MERLTERFDDGILKGILVKEKYGEHVPKTLFEEVDEGYLGMCVLKAYEDTGLAPEQIEELLSRENASEITRLSRDNDGWIPVEKAQPEEDGFYIATMDGEIVGQEETFVGLAEFENGKWIDDEEDYKCVIAWRPLPEPYRTERSNDEKE